MKKMDLKHSNAAMTLGLCAAVFTACARIHSATPTPENSQSNIIAPGPNDVSIHKFMPAPIATIPIRYDYKAGELTQLCQQAMKNATARLDQIAHLPEAQRTFDETTLAFEASMADLSDATTPLTFMGYVSTNAGTHAEGSDCEDQVNQYDVGATTRKDLYLALSDSRPENKPRTDAEKRLLSQTLLQFEMNGLKLPDEQLAQMRQLKQKLASMEAQFSTNLNNDVTSVHLSDAELKGVTDDYKSSLKKADDGKYILPVNEASYPVVMQEAELETTRQKILIAYWNRAADKNVKLLEDAIQTREQIAAKMDYKTWADYRIKGRMAKDGQTVLNFLNGLQDKLSRRNLQDINELKAFKATLKSHDPAASDEVRAWDIPYLQYQAQKANYSINDDLIREYFPADVVINGLFGVYSHMLGVQFVELTQAKTWAPDVKLYEIHNDDEAKTLIGYFYTDFVPRLGKYGHAVAFPLISGRMLDPGVYSLPVSAIVANLAPPMNGKPSLLNRNEVETIFHEFGHIMHQTLTRAPYASLSGSNVAQDFVEAPSQMLENWTWDMNVLRMLSGKYDDHSQKLPEDLLKKMIASRDFQQSYYYTRQLMLATLDMDYHTQTGPVDPDAVYNKLYKEMITIDGAPGTHFSASFGHLMGGYDAGYYGYLWSEVYAQDMFSKFQEKGLLNSEMGAWYRKTILERGNMMDAMDLLRQFLGREPGNEAFLKKLHISE